MIGDMLPVPDHICKNYMRDEGFEKELSKEEAQAFQSDLIHYNNTKNIEPAIKINGNITYT